MGLRIVALSIKDSTQSPKREPLEWGNYLEMRRGTVQHQCEIGYKWTVLLFRDPEKLKRAGSRSE